MIKTLSWIFLMGSLHASSEMESYLEKRNEALALNENKAFDAKILLSPEEEEVNLKLEMMKRDLLSMYQRKKITPFSQNFLITKEHIQNNPLYSLIQKMPKGGLLHVHSASIMESEWLIRELTTLPDCYVYWLDEGPLLKGTFQFFEKEKVPDGFFSVAELRETLKDFDEILLSLLEMEKTERVSSNLWEKFEGWFIRTKGLIHYKPAFIKYYIHSMETLIEDNIQYMELRALNFPVYQLDGTEESLESLMETYLEVKKEVQKKNPDFDFKIIYTEHRNAPKEKTLEKIEKAYELRSLYPHFVIGYDLVGEEDTGRTTLDYVDAFFEAKQFEQKYGVDLPYYFHDGETASAYSLNLYDAVLLNSKRIGHGLNLFHFPYLMDRIKEKNICLEVCPISNQVLGYVPDLRMHPAAGYLKAGIPCVIGSDDPGLFGYKGISSDLWESVLAWDLDLKSLKLFFINSVLYSGMAQEEKKSSLNSWQEKWDRFIKESL